MHIMSRIRASIQHHRRSIVRKFPVVRLSRVDDNPEFVWVASVDGLPFEPSVLTRIDFSRTSLAEQRQQHWRMIREVRVRREHVMPYTCSGFAHGDAAAPQVMYRCISQACQAKCHHSKQHGAATGAPARQHHHPRGADICGPCRFVCHANCRVRSLKFVVGQCRCSHHYNDTTHAFSFDTEAMPNTLAMPSAGAARAIIPNPRHQAIAAHMNVHTIVASVRAMSLVLRLFWGKGYPVCRSIVLLTVRLVCAS